MAKPSFWQRLFGGTQPSNQERVRRVRENSRLVEASQLYGDLPGYPFIDGRDLFSEVGPYGFQDVGVPYSLGRRDNRMTGEVLPAFINGWQLKIIRDRARQIARSTEYAIAAINAKRAYVVGTGFKYRCALKKGIVGNYGDLIKRANDLLELWAEHNDMPAIESEIVQRYDAEGEAFIRSFRGRDGLLRHRFVEPELVRSPNDDNTPNNSFGIKCADEDIHEIEGYWIIERPWENQNPQFVEADEVLHLKANVESNSKRGLPTIWAVESNLRAAEDILQSMVSLAKARAKVAIIRKVEDSPPEAISALTETATDYTLTDPASSQTTNITRFGYGTILTASGNVSYEFPGANLGSADMVETLRANLRAIAARFGLSEAMLSADPSSANYASALVAEAPATKQLEHFQRLLAGALGTRRTNPGRSLAWNQLRLGVDVGILPKEALTLLDVQCEVPNVASRDKLQEAQVNSIYLDKGITSKSTVRSKIGEDNSAEEAQIQKEKAQDAADSAKYGPPAGAPGMGQGEPQAEVQPSGESVPAPPYPS